MKPRLERLESLRAIACIVVFTYHAYLSHNAYWSINVFFTLTAFLMTYNGLGKLERYPSGLIGCARFAWGKVKRLYPLYFISLLILILRIILLAPENPPVEQLIIFAKQFVLCALLIQSWPPETSWAFAFNVVGWYISTSLFLYFCFPALLRRISKIKSRRAALFAIIVIYVLMVAVAAGISALHAARNPDSYAQQNFQQWLSFVCPVFRLGDFTIGCLAGYIFSRSDYAGIDRKKGTLIEIAALVLFFIGYGLFRIPTLPKYMIYNLLFILPVTALVYAFAIGKGAVSRVLDNKVTRLIADYSVEVFLIHDVAILYASPLSNFLPLPHHMQQLVFVVFTITVTIGASLLYRRFSRRFPFFAVK